MNEQKLIILGMLHHQTFEKFELIKQVQEGLDISVNDLHLTIQDLEKNKQIVRYQDNDKINYMISKKGIIEFKEMFSKWKMKCKFILTSIEGEFGE